MRVDVYEGGMVWDGKASLWTTIWKIREKDSIRSTLPIRRRENRGRQTGAGGEAHANPIQQNAPLGLCVARA